MSLSIKNKKGSMLVEIMVSIAVLSMLLVAFGKSLGVFRSINHFYISKQRCISAAQAQLDSIAVTGKTINNDTFEQLWPHVDVNIERSTGTGDWTGLTLVKVTAETQTGGRNVEIMLSRYMDNLQKVD